MDAQGPPCHEQALSILAGAPLLLTPGRCVTGSACLLMLCFPTLCPMKGHMCAFLCEGPVHSPWMPHTSNAGVCIVKQH